MNLSRLHEVVAPPADIVPGLTVVHSAVAGLDVGDGVTLSGADKVSVFIQTVSSLRHRWAGITAAGESYRTSFDDVS